MKLRKDRVRVWHEVKVAKRIYFRWATPEDADREYLGWLRDPESQRWLSYPSRTLTELRRYIRSQVNTPHVAMFMIHHRNGQKLQPWSDARIGTIKLVFKKNEASVGLMIGRWRGEGFGSEAIRLACAYAKFQGAVRVTCGIHAANIASITAFQRAGFIVTPKIMEGSRVV